MGRKRKNNELQLPSRVYQKHGAFYYVHPSGRWERIGTDLAEARKRGHHYNDPDSIFGTMQHYLQEFILHCEKRTKLPRDKGGMSTRTFEDYKKTTIPLIAFFGKMTPSQVQGHHVAEYLDVGVEMNRSVRANREKATLSACFTWLLRQSGTGISVNPCIGIRRNPERKRDRYVTHEEYRAVWKKAQPSVRALLDLIYRTLQRPEDIINWTPANIIIKSENDGTKVKVIRTQQGKTDAHVDIAVSPEIEQVLQTLRRPTGSLEDSTRPLLLSRKNEPYTYSGLTSMLQRYVKSTSINGKPIPSFGFYDMKGKGATDMWLAGVPLEEIQALCGHDSVTTTEIYVKCRWRDTIQSNKTSIKQA